MIKGWGRTGSGPGVREWTGVDRGQTWEQGFVSRVREPGSVSRTLRHGYGSTARDPGHGSGGTPPVRGARDRSEIDKKFWLQIQSRAMGHGGGSTEVEAPAPSLSSSKDGEDVPAAPVGGIKGHPSFNSDQFETLNWYPKNGNKNGKILNFSKKMGRKKKRQKSIRQK